MGRERTLAVGLIDPFDPFVIYEVILHKSLKMIEWVDRIDLAVFALTALGYRLTSLSA